MSEVFSLTSSEMQKEGSERRKKNPLALRLTPVNQYLKLFRKGIGNTVLDCETYCYHSRNILHGQGMTRKTSVVQTEAMGLNVNVRRAVAAILTGASDATCSTVTAEKMEEQCAVAKVTKVIAVCCT